MIDIHNHILPELDDGAADSSIALAMVRQAADDGIQTVMATPHFRTSQFQVEGSRVRQAASDFNQLLRNRGIPLQVLAGQEIRVTACLLEDLMQQRAIPLGDTRYLLLELPVQGLPPDWAWQLCTDT